MVTHDTTRSISGLARALAQQGVMSEQEAEALQSQAQASGVTFVEQVLAGKRISATQLAIFASRAFGVPLLDLSSFDIDQIIISSNLGPAITAPEPEGFQARRRSWPRLGTTGMMIMSVISARNER